MTYTAASIHESHGAGTSETDKSFKNDNDDDGAPPFDNEECNSSSNSSHENTNDEKDPNRSITPPSIRLSGSPSKRAVQIMNLTSGLCADPIHYHSFSAVSSSWLYSPSSSFSLFSTPKCLFVGAFQKCAACHGRLGYKSNCPRQGEDSSVVNCSEGMDSGSFSSSGMSMLQCVACGVYAHRSCAFLRPSCLDYVVLKNGDDDKLGVEGDCGVGMPICEVNLALIKKAVEIPTTHEQATIEKEEIPTPAPATSQSSWSIFGRSHAATDTKQDQADDNSCDQNFKPENYGPDIDESTFDNHLNNQPCHAGNKSSDMGIPNPLTDEEVSTSLLQKPTSSKEEEKSTTASPPPPGVFKTSVELIKKTSETTKRIPKASAIGMVAGGVAGLVIAGPAGGVIGCQVGRTALAVGAAVEGGISIGVLVMSLATAAKFSLSSVSGVTSSGKEQKTLKLLGQESNTLVLVRPDIEVDPIWEDYVEEARQMWEKKRKESPRSWGSGISHLFTSSTKNENSASPERDTRYLRDEDIIKVDSSELAMREKVLLLVNRILNDKLSLPGYVYRYLIRKTIVRSTLGDEDTKSADLLLGNGNTDVTSSTKSVTRSCRQDAHGIIKHVTATLIKVRPGLASSPKMTEMSASAVEVLVFGELYDGVFGEIVNQTREQDESLSAKVEELNVYYTSSENERSNDGEMEAFQQIPVSQSAIAALKALPQAHTPADKLFRCVEFLEHVSEQFSLSNDMSRCIDADTLLKMVCQHIVAAKVKNLHAEVVFIEEFSRDEQLLRGKEGYALITLQASLHYLDSLKELDYDLHPLCH